MIRVLVLGSSAISVNFECGMKRQYASLPLVLCGNEYLVFVKEVGLELLFRDAQLILLYPLTLSNS